MLRSASSEPQLQCWFVPWPGSQGLELNRVFGGRSYSPAQRLEEMSSSDAWCWAQDGDMESRHDGVLEVRGRDPKRAVLCRVWSWADGNFWWLWTPR